MRDVLVAIADWKIDEAQFLTISESPGWERLSEEARALVKASYLYYEEGEFPSTNLVSLTPPQLIQSAPKFRGVQ
ncbi:hypothetical protein CFBP2118_01074 [Pseudomonas syringae pv. syringae]|nr:hypothetical protein CFBP2118_01074 [Pseudomonas syringae pv. syringae]